MSAKEDPRMSTPPSTKEFWVVDGEVVLAQTAYEAYREARTPSAFGTCKLRRTSLAPADVLSLAKKVAAR